METVSGTANVYEVSPEAMAQDPQLGNTIAGATIHFEGFEVGDEVIGWAGVLEVTVDSSGAYVEAIHPSEEAARGAATARASGD
jgi:hypothetical protein